MMYDFVKKVSPDNSEAVKKEINRIENKYHITLPTVYKDYALHCDGTTIQPRLLNIDGYRCEVSKIVTLCGDGLTFEKIVCNDRMDGFLSSNLYPVASDRGGNIFYWDSKDNAVYLILSDDIDNPFCVSESVEEFFDRLMLA